MPSTCWNASGARGFFGEGYWWHKWLIDWRGSGFIAKTITTKPRKGNMSLTNDWGVKEWWPDCVKINWRKGAVLNAVGLSNLGAEAFVRDYAIRLRALGSSAFEPFMISWMPDNELEEFRNLLKELKALPYSLQVNLSCPNVDERWSLEKNAFMLECLRRLDKPIYVKVNALEPIKNVVDLSEWIAGVSCSNSIPWGSYGEIDWEGLFGKMSPLAAYGGGGLSGAPLLPLTESWIRRLRGEGFTKTIMGGGGVLSVRDADRILQAGANMVELGSVAILRPWNIKGIIEYVRCSSTSS